MDRFHIDPATGDPAQCTTSAGDTTDTDPCPVGIADAQHRHTVEDTYALMEDLYAAFVLPIPLKRTGPVDPDRRAAILAWRNPSVCSAPYPLVDAGSTVLVERESLS